MRQISHLSLATILLVPLVLGCRHNPKMDIATVTQPAPRPAQLDRLTAFLGQWEWSTEIKDASGKTVTGTGSSTVTWEADKRVLLERYEGKVGEQPASFIAVWTYDPRHDRYPVFIADSQGNESHGTVAYDPATQIWLVQITMRLLDGQTMDDEETLRFKHANTMQWSSTLRSGGKTVMEIKGVARRK